MSQTTNGDDKAKTYGSDNELSFVEENERYRLTLITQNGQMECVVEIEIFPPEVKVKKTTVNTECDDGNTEPVSGDIEPVDSDVELSDVDEKPAPIISPPDIFWFLQQNNIVQTIEYPAVYSFCAAIEMGTKLQPTVLAHGIEPIAGADGWFELTVKTTGENTEFKEDEDGNIDFKLLNAYTEIEIGQKLGIVHPPKDGINGIDVCGLPVMAQKGKPFELIGGEGVELKFDNRVAFATKSGRALHEKQTVSVVDQLVVTGNVDLSIGNIDFNGFVEVGGDVPDDFDIQATKGVKIGGAVGACHIESAGAVEIASMAGREIGRITCHGDLHATFLNQVMVQCFGDVYVTNEIRNSVIKATGKIVVERGAIIGGSCTARDGIEVKNLGATSGIKTRVVAGVYFPDADRFEYLRNQLQIINRQIKSIAAAMEPLKRNIRNDDNLATTAKIRMSILEEQLAKIQLEKEIFGAEINASTPQEFGSKNPKINVFDTLMEGVSIVLGQETAEVKIARTGPLSIIENSRQGGFYYLTLTPMQVSAGQLEEEIIAAEKQQTEPTMAQN
ncbi:MAG: DUF342 domain-containing protein [Desulfuromonadales bacterium]|nr:DUF342 domain-containing protein [Desulfuromonadales bacterium]